MAKHHLYSPLSKAELVRLHEEGKTVRQIAKLLGLNHVLVFRAMVHHGIPQRSKSEAQKLALEEGRSKHPTEGTERSAHTKAKIGDSLVDFWDNNKHLLEIARERSRKMWENFSEEKRKDIISKSHVSLKKASIYGSKLENFIFTFLNTKKIRTELHKKSLVASEQLEIDLFLPEDGICIEIDGPSHYFPIYGDAVLEKRQETDTRKNGLLLQKGYIVIRVKNLMSAISQARMRNFCKTLLKEIIKFKIQIPEDPLKRLVFLDMEEFKWQNG